LNSIDLICPPHYNQYALGLDTVKFSSGVCEHYTEIGLSSETPHPRREHSRTMKLSASVAHY